MDSACVDQGIKLCHDNALFHGNRADFDHPSAALDGHAGGFNIDDDISHGHIHTSAGA
jgi:hypothetical protein